MKRDSEYGYFIMEDLPKRIGAENAGYLFIAAALLMSRISNTSEELSGLSNSQVVACLDKEINKIIEEMPLSSEMLHHFRGKVEIALKNPNTYINLFEIIECLDVESLLSTGLDCCLGNIERLKPSYILKNLMEQLIDVNEQDVVLDFSAGAGDILESIYSQNIFNKLVAQEENINLATLLFLRLLIEGKELDFTNFDVYLGDALENPMYLNNEIKYNKIISMLPLNKKIIDVSNKYERFSLGKITNLSFEWAYVWDAISSLSFTGKAVILMSNGALFRGGVSRRIREMFIKHNWIEAVISLPIKSLRDEDMDTSIVIINKNKKQNVNEKTIQFIKMDTEEVDEIVNIYKTKAEVKDVSINVKLQDLKQESLSVATYVFEKQFDLDDIQVRVDFDKLKNINTIPLKDIADITRGYNLTKDKENSLGTYSVIQLSNIKNNEIDYQNLQRTDFKGHRVSDYMLQKNDILINIRGANNKVAIVNEDVSNVLFNATMVRLRVGKEYLPEWLKLYFESPMAQALLTTIKYGTVIKQISINDLKRLPVPDFNIEEQQAMVEEYISDMVILNEQMKILKEKEYSIKEKFYKCIDKENAIKIMKWEK